MIKKKLISFLDNLSAKEIKLKIIGLNLTQDFFAITHFKSYPSDVKKLHFDEQHYYLC